MTRVGTITLGHAPRTDITDDMRRELPDDAVIEEAGALDPFDAADDVEAAVGVREGEPPFVTSLRDGSTVHLDREGTAALIQERILEMMGEVALVGILCTGEFPEFESSVPVLETGDLLRSWARSLVGNGTLGVMVPEASQIDTARSEFEGLSVIPAAGSPYETGDTIARAAEEIGTDADVIAMKCMGYDYAMEATVRDVTATPTLLPRSILVKTISELL